MQKTILKAGSLALWDSFSGMIRIRIESVHNAKCNMHSIRFRIMSRNHPVYKRGEVITETGLHIVPRNIRYKRGTYGQKYICPPFEFETDN